MGLLSNTITTGSNRTWCRPSHRTNCVLITGGSACCVCIPSTATCYVIEMWGQGGGGAGASCCMAATVGGMGGDYGWVTSTINGTAQTLCACSCNCACASLTTCTGHVGQISRVCNCTTSVNWTVCGGLGGISMCPTLFLAGQGYCGLPIDFNPNHSPLAFYCCLMLPSKLSFCGTNCGLDNTTTQASWFKPDGSLPFQIIQGSNWLGYSCSCCTNFNFYVRGGCGWTAPSLMPMMCNICTSTYQYLCGAYNGQGGMSYAGSCGISLGSASSSFNGSHGTAPGGGGQSGSAFGSSCYCGGCGGLGMILISWS